MTPFLSIILPLHNEVDRLPDAVEKITSQRWPFEVEIIAVENGSSDDTYELGRFYADTVDNFYIHSIPERGKGAAVREGMLKATGQWRYMADVDFSTPVEIIYQYLNAALTLRADLVIGVRPQRAGLRAWMAGLFRLAVRPVLPGILDSQCGFKLFSGAAADHLFNCAQLTGMAFDVELLYLARQAGYTIVQTPVPWEHNTDSRVRLVGDSLAMLADVYSIPRRHRPQMKKLPA